MDDNVTIEIDIPQTLLSRVEEQSRERDESVSHFFCRGAETLLRRHKERLLLEQYVEARTRMPDPEEVKKARSELDGTPD